MTSTPDSNMNQMHVFIAIAYPNLSIHDPLLSFILSFSLVRPLEAKQITTCGIYGQRRLSTVLVSPRKLSVLIETYSPGVLVQGWE